MKPTLFLAIDIGNSHTNFALFRNNLIIFSFYAKTSKLLRKSTLKKFLRESLELIKVNKKILNASGISSVVPKANKTYLEAITEVFDFKPFFVTNKTPIPFKIHTDNPEQVGTDRICNVMAAYKKYGGPLVIIDFGTATNYDVVAENGDFRGGIIAPGIKISATALSNAAALLHEIELKFPPRIIGTNTIDNMQSGILFGALLSMEGFVKRITKEIGKKPIVIASGGFSGLISQHSGVIDHIETNLVLHGIKNIFDYNCKKRKLN